MTFNYELLKSDLLEKRTKQRTIPVLERQSQVSTTTINSIIHKNRAVTMKTFIKLCNYLKTPPERYFKHEH